MSKTVKDLLFEDNKPKEDCFNKIKVCPLCKSKKNKYLFKQWGFSYYKCKKCGFVYSNLRLTDKGANLWYNSDYYNAAMEKEYFMVENSNKYYSISLNNLLSNFYYLFEKQNFSKDIKIADIGCGSGSILHYLRDELGYKNIIGFDLNKANSNFAEIKRNLIIKNIDIYKLNPKEKFDVVITTENIEHVSDPLKYIEIIKKLVKPGGFLFITTPHNDEKATKWFGLYGDHFCAPNHQNYFNFKNLSDLLIKNEFRIKDYWMLNDKKLNSYTFFIKYITKRDQITAFPPINPALKRIWRWQKDVNKSVVLNHYSFNNKPETTTKVNKKSGIKILIKNTFSIFFSFKITSHQVIIAQLNSE